MSLKQVVQSFNSLLEEMIMCKRFLFLITFFAMLGTASTAFAAFWDGGGADRLWTTPENWVGDVAPALGDGPYIDAIDLVPGGWNGPLFTDGMFFRTERLRGPGVTADPCTMTFELTGGELIVNKYWNVCGEAGSYGHIIFDGGYVHNTTGYTGDAWSVIRGSATIDFYDGLVDLTGIIRMPKYVEGTATFNLYNGLIRCRNYDIRQPNAKLNVGDGIIVMSNAARGNLYFAPYITGRVFAMDGNDVIRASEDENGWFYTVAAAPPGQAYSPYPVYFQEGVGNWGDLSWLAGDYAAKHALYFGTDRTAVEDATDPNVPPGRGIIPLYIPKDANDANRASFDPRPLSPATTYYWRVDEINDACAPGLWKGPIWSFTTGDGKATNPTPGDGASNLLKGTVSQLTWTPGEWAQKHAVYYGTSFEDVNSATDPNVYPGLGLVTNAQISGFTTGLGQTYYWRVDEYNIEGSVSRGDIWSFTMAPFDVLDDFEAYNTIDNQIYDTWKDWHDDGNNGATVTLVEDPTFAHDGDNCMALWYDNDWYDYSESERTFSPAVDLTGGGLLKGLIIYFRGDKTNIPELMSITLSDGTTSKTTAYDGDPYEIVKEQWKAWGIVISDLAACGLDVTKITKVKISFADDYNGYGTVYFDDLATWMPKCVSDLVPVDLSGDCAVDEADLEQLRAAWLVSGYTATATAADTNHLVVWYKFEETDGNTAADSANYDENNYSAAPESGTVTPFWDPCGVVGRSCYFKNGTGVDLMVGNTDLLDDNFDQDITFTCWAKHDSGAATDSGSVLFQFTHLAGGYFRARQWQSSNPDAYMTFEGCTWEDNMDDVADWFHFAGVVNGHRNYEALYINGKLIDYNPNTNTEDPADMYDCGIGGRPLSNNRDWGGWIDEFKVWNKALTHSEIMGEAGTPGTIVVPATLLTEADINDDDVVNLKDFASIANEWMQTILWPDER